MNTRTLVPLCFPLVVAAAVACDEGPGAPLASAAAAAPGAPAADASAPAPETTRAPAAGPGARPVPPAGAAPPGGEAKRTYFVAPTGDDAQCGDRDHPFRTLQRAADVVQPGETVHVLPGDYDGFSVEGKAGTAEAPVRFVAEAGARVVRPAPAVPPHPPLNTALYTYEWPQWPHGIFVWGSSHVTFEGFEVVDMPGALFDANGHRLHKGGAGFHLNESRHVAVRHGRAERNGRWGIFTSFVEDVVLEDNVTSRSVAEHGIYVSNSADRPVLRRNVAAGNGGAGIQINADNNYDSEVYRSWGAAPDGVIRGAVVEGNVLYGNGAKGGAAINLDGVQDSLVAGNLLYDNHATGIALFQSDGAEGSSRNRVVGNTVVMAGDARWAVNVLNCEELDPADPRLCASANSPPIEAWQGLRPLAYATGSTGNVVADNVLVNLNPAAGAVATDGASLAPDARTGRSLVSDRNVVVDRFAIDGGLLSLDGWRARTGQDVRSTVVDAAAPPAGP